jgi:hypothetical protein
MTHDVVRSSRKPKRPANPELVPRDLTTINVENQAELAYWCAYFRCTGSELRAAIAAVGTSAKAVAQHLRALAPGRNV